VGVVPGKERQFEANRNGGSTVRAESGRCGGGRRAPVTDDELWWVLQHEWGRGLRRGRWWRTMMVDGGSSP
jgi:hypothetical protein